MEIVLTFILAFLIIKGHGASVSVKTPPEFSSHYTVQGILYIPYAEIREPFYAWYDLSKGSSRIDYYGGMVKTYQLSKEEDFGTSLKVAPLTTEKVTNQVTCFKISGSSDAPVAPQTILPNLKNFTFIGEDMLNGISCEKWFYEQTCDDKVNKYTAWIRKEGDRLIPVRYEMKGYNSLLGSHYDHYYLEYEWFSDQSPNPSVFSLEKNMTCQSFPGPGMDHVYTFNPMKEFVHNDDGHVKENFEDFMDVAGKRYENQTEHALRFDHFRQNMRFITSHNRANKGFSLSVNHMADRSPSELKAFRGKIYTNESSSSNGGKPFPYTRHQINNFLASIPESLDWRLAGAVTPIKDQSVCGSCWSFGTVGTLEGAYFLKYGKQKKFSQQALIDCSWGYGNNGCDGGEDFRSYQWIMKHGGIPTEDDYGPYLGQDGYCHVDNKMEKMKITDFVNVTSGDLDALKVAIALHGPVSVAIDASPRTFTFYSTGVYYEPECGNTVEKLDHAVLAVGYGKLDGKDYWLVKNSWSNYWGNSGFVLISQKDNNCGVATSPTYVNID